MVSLILSLTLKLYLNSLVYGLPQKSSAIFRNIRLAFGKTLENLRESSKSGRKSSENRQKRRHQYVYIVKRTLHVSSKI